MSSRFFTASLIFLACVLAADILFLSRTNPPSVVIAYEDIDAARICHSGGFKYMLRLTPSSVMCRDDNMDYDEVNTSKFIQDHSR